MGDASASTPLARPGLTLGLLLLGYLPAALLRWPWEVDEVRYVEVAREMRVSGEWLVPHLNGETYSEKPPLFFWLVGGLGGLVGEPRAGQLLAALAVVVTAFLTVRLGRLLGDGDERLAWTGGAALACSVMLIDRGQAALIDTLLLPLVTAGTLALLEAARSRGGRAVAWSAGACLACAAACLAKGPVGLLFPLLGAGLAGAATRGREGLRLLALGLAPLGGAATLLWLWLASRAAGGGLWERMLFQQTAKRLGGGTVHHPEAPWFYLLQVPHRLLPWAVLLPGALLLARHGPPAGWRRAGRAAALWAGVGLLLFSIPGGKRPGYILPLFVPLALLCASAVVGAAEAPGTRGRRWVTLPLGLVPPLLAAQGALLLLAAPTTALALGLAEPSELAAAQALPTLAWAVVPALGLIALWLAREAARAARGEDWVRVARALAGGVAIVAGIQGLVAVPVLEPKRSGRVLAEAVLARVPAEDRLVLLAGHHDGRLNLWTGARHYDVVQPEALPAEVARPGRLWVLAREAPFTLVEPSTRARFAHELEWPGGEKNDFILLREGPSAQ